MRGLIRNGSTVSFSILSLSNARIDALFLIRICTFSGLSAILVS